MWKNTISPLFTDLYELTMGAAYFEKGLFNDAATFSLFIRGYSRGRNFYIASGLEDALTALENLQFSSEDLAYVSSLNLFSSEFLAYLRSFRFTGDIRAIPEGTLFFGDEPLMEVTAPIIEAQIVETFLINALGLPVLVATKAARCLHAARNRQLIDFSLRRTQGVDAGLKVAKSSYIAGFSGTSNVMAGKIYGIPVSGTMAHSFVTTFEDEVKAFRAYAEVFPGNAVFLIDTYDTVKGAQNAVIVAKEMAEKGYRLRGVRLDSGDMVALSKQVRTILDQAGFEDVKIFASSGFDEAKIARHLSEGAQIDAFGVGTKLGVSADVPYLDIVYKMVQHKDQPVRKFSEGKKTLAGEKQVFRKTDKSGLMAEDVIGTRNETVANAAPILIQVMKGGQKTRPSESLADIRTRCTENLARFPDHYKTLAATDYYPVAISQKLQNIQAMLG